MKTNWLVGSVILAGAMVLRAQTNDLSAALRQGLFEEEANRNLDAAISNYQSLATQFDRDRQIAATAIFRLGECYRKLGQTNDAVIQYQRIIREFSDQQTLATLSQQNLTGLGTTPQASSPSATTSESTAKTAELEAEAAALKAQIAHLSGLSGANRRTTIQQNFPNPVLTTLMQQLNEAEQNLASLTNDYAPTDLHVARVTALVNAINGQIDTQVEGVIKGLQAKMEADLDAAKALREQSGPVQAVHTEASTVTDDEDQEIRRIQQLIQDSPDLINAPASDGFTPLGNAARNGRVKVATFLLDHGAGINVAQRAGVTALHGAARAGNRAMVELLLSRGADVNSKEVTGQTPLHIAANKGFQAVVEVLLANKVDVNAQDDSGNTPLHLAAGDQVKIIQTLLAAGANPNVENSQGRTPLSFAAESGSPEVVINLLAAKADPNGGKLDAPLLCAIHKNDAAVAELLLQAGANPNAKREDDWQPSVLGPFGRPVGRGWETPLSLAVSTKQLPMVQLLLKFKADPDDSQTDGRPLLFSALPDTNILETLLDAGAKVDVCDRNETFKDVNVYQPLLNSAVAIKNAASVGLLLKHGANANSPDNNGYTPLHVAATYLVEREIFELLLAYKADPNVRNHDGRTPLDLLKEFQGQNISANGLPVPGSTFQGRLKNLLERNDSAEQEKIKLAGELADLLRQHGALDNLPNWDRITVSRPSANFSASFFWKGTNDWNQFTLLEVLARQYELLQHSTRGTWNTRQTTIRDFWDKNPCRFPDLQRMLIHRPSPDGRRWTILTVDVAKLLQTGDCSMDQPLHWGDVVEIPETDHPVTEQWDGLTPDDLNALLKCASRRITISLKGTNATLTLSPECVPNERGFGRLNHELVVTPACYALCSVLDQSKLLRASSDLSRVKVTRRDPATGKKQEWVLDCSGDNAPNLWLRDGDVIEVPEK